MDFPIHIDIISMELPIGTVQVEFSNLCLLMSLYVALSLANNAGPDEMQHYNAAFHLGLHCLPKYLFMGFRYTKGYF